MLNWHFQAQFVLRLLKNICTQYTPAQRFNNLWPAFWPAFWTCFVGIWMQTTAMAAPLIINDVGTPTTNGSGQGERAVWTDGGSVGGMNVDIVLEVLMASQDHDIETVNNRPAIRSTGQDNVQLEWRLYESGSYNPATNTGTLVVADVHVQFNDVDGPNNEQVFIPACAGAVEWIRIDQGATTGLAFGTVSGVAEMVSLIGDKAYTSEPESGLEVYYPNVSSFQMGRTANDRFFVRLDNPTYNAFTTLDYQCADFNAPTANDDSGAGTLTNPVVLSILNNDSIALLNNNGPNNNTLAPSEYAVTAVSLVLPAGAMATATDSDGDLVGFSVPGEGSWTYDDSTGQLTYTPLVAGTPTPIQYTFENALGVMSNAAMVTVSYTSPIVAVAEAGLTVSGASGGMTTTVLASDTLGGVAVVLADVTITVDATDPELVLDPLTGLINIAPATSAANYSVTYTICENATPANCSSVTEMVAVTASSINAVAEPALTVGGLAGGMTTTVLASDTLGGVAVVLADVTITAGPSSSELVLDPATGLITVLPATPAANYNAAYTICENANPSNCSTVNETVTVTSPLINAVAEPALTVGGLAGGMTTTVLASDTLGGVAVVLADVTITVDATDPELDLDTFTGLIIIAPATSAATYSVTYTICEKANAANCSTVTETVAVTSPSINAVAEPALTVGGLAGGMTTTVLASDTLGGVAVVLADVTITVDATDPELVLDPSTGLINIAPATSAANYSLTYTICENANAANCSTVTETVAVTSPSINAVAEPALTVGGLAGGMTTTVLASDTLGGVAVVLADVTITVDATDPELVLDPSTGLINIAPATSAANYSLTYTICEKANAANCSSVTETVAVITAIISAVEEPVYQIAGQEGGVTGSVLASDTLGGVLVNPSDVTITVGAGSPELVLDPATGLITVAANTPAGSYHVEYTVCENLNSSNCSTITECVDVTAPEIMALADIFTPIRGYEGGTTMSVLTSDRLGNVPADLMNVVLNAGPILNPEGVDASQYITLNADGTIQIAPQTADGTYRVEYTICEILNAANCSTIIENLVVEPSTTALSGVVYLDLNDDQTRQDSEPLYVNWTVELINSVGDIVATTKTDENGYYEIADIAIGMYSVAFRNPDNNVTYNIIENIVLDGSQTVLDQSLPIDPSGVIYDAVSRAPIAGAVLTMVDPMGNPLPTSCFIDPLQQGQPSDSQGRYRFDLIPGAAATCPITPTNYTIEFSAPTGYNAGLSTVIGPQAGPLITPAGTGPYEVSPLETAPQNGDDTSYYLSFQLGQGSRDVINNHIPVDPVTLVRTPMDVVKTSPKSSVSFAALVPYTVIVTNTESLPRIDLDIIDYTPAGFKYVAGSARLDGVSINPVISGRELIIAGQDFAAGQSKTLELVLVVGAGVGEGQYTNQAFVRDALGVESSNRGTARVRVVPDPLFDCSELIGKVFDDRNHNGSQDVGEVGLPGVRIATAKGLLVTTDQHGRYHIACAAVPNQQIGSNFILKIDTRTLPANYNLTTENPRVVRLTRGKLSKANFGATGLTVVNLDLADAAFNGLALAPAYLPHLQPLIGQLKARPSVLQINYQTNLLDQNLVTQRLSALSSHVQNIWLAQGCCKPIRIETKIIRPNGNSLGQVGNGQVGLHPAGPPIVVPPHLIRSHAVQPNQHQAQIHQNQAQIHRRQAQQYQGFVHPNQHQREGR